MTLSHRFVGPGDEVVIVLSDWSNVTTNRGSIYSFYVRV